MSRIDKKFSELKSKNKKAFVSYIMASDPDLGTSLKIMHEFVSSGVDIIELGMPFSDPMAEGPIIQKAAGRSLESGCKIVDVIDLVKKFREDNTETPIILMGYFNPIFSYGIKRFVADSENAGVDGFIIVDLPPEEESELTDDLVGSPLSLIKLTTPTTNSERAEIVLKNSGGFVYYVSVAGVTGVKEANLDSVQNQISKLKEKTDLPICVGFGIKTPEQAKEISKYADGIVIGSVFVKIIQDNLQNPKEIVKLCGEFAQFVRTALDS